MSRRKRDRVIDMDEDEIVEDIECPNCGCKMHEQQIRCRECGERKGDSSGILGIL